jgi:hypothetical protein
MLETAITARMNRVPTAAATMPKTRRAVRPLLTCRVWALAIDVVAIAVGVLRSGSENPLTESL